VADLPRRAPAFRSLTRRNFRLFFTGQLVSAVGNWFTNIAVTLFVLHLTDNGVALGGLAACQFGPMLVLSLWAGALVDRVDKRRLLVATQVVAALQSAAFAALAFAGRPPLAAVYAVALIGGMVLAVDVVARRAFVVELVEPELVTNAVSLNTAIQTSSVAIGTTLAGLLVTVIGYRWCFTIDACSYVAPIAALARMDPTRIRRSPPLARAPGQVRSALRYVRATPALWLPLAMAGLIGTFAMNLQVVLPLFATRTLHSGAAMFSFLFAVVSVGSLLGALWVARHTTLRITQAVGTAALMGGAGLALAGAPGWWLAFPVGFVVGLAMTAFTTASTGTVQLAAAPDARGRVLALQSMVLFGGSTLGGPLVGAVSQEWGARAGLALGGVAALGAAALGLVVVRRHPSLRADPVRN